MKLQHVLLPGLVLLGAWASASAEETWLSSRSAGKYRADQSLDLSMQIKNSEPLVREKSQLPENYDAGASAQRSAGVANRHDQLFEIYRADVELSGDLDYDGYYHGLNVSFDVDVSYDDATIYAKLYLSREGEPWSQYFTTDLFVIHGDEVSDAYEVETELVDGYEPGYYDVLIEIYSLDHAHMVTSEVLDHHYLGKDVPLEDLHWDEPPHELHGRAQTSVHAGSMSALLPFFLLLQVLIAARGALAHTPRKKSEQYNKKGSPGLRSVPGA